MFNDATNFVCPNFLCVVVVPTLPHKYVHLNLLVLLDKVEERLVWVHTALQDGVEPFIALHRLKEREEPELEVAWHPCSPVFIEFLEVAMHRPPYFSKSATHFRSNSARVKLKSIHSLKSLNKSGILANTAQSFSYAFFMICQRQQWCVVVWNFLLIVCAITTSWSVRMVSGANPPIASQKASNS